MADEAKHLPEFLNFDYVKSNQFRVIHADGAFFALTARGGLTISFFAERQPIPRRVVHKVNEDGTLGNELTDQRVVRDAIIRDTEVAVTMDFDTARRISERLDEILKRAEELNKQVGQSRNQQ